MGLELFLGTLVMRLENTRDESIAGHHVHAYSHQGQSLVAKPLTSMFWEVAGKPWCTQRKPRQVQREHAKLHTDSSQNLGLIILFFTI